MASKDEVIAMAKEAIMELDGEMAEEAAQEGLKAGVAPVEIIEAYAAAMADIGVEFEAGKLFLPHLLAASEAMGAGMAILKPELEKTKAQTESKGKIVVGTIEGDIHSIGKDIVVSMLGIAGFDVVDLGRDVPIKTFVEAVKEHNPVVVGSSALMTTTMINQIQIEEQLKEAGVRDSVKTMVGGAPCTQDWADKIGADIYGESASDAVSKVKVAAGN
ncbi:Methionine synthase [Methanimicrococcus stummii]|uniref:Methionine synthase n=1 Tax=Methanimicrococcus stummii TaxID=3028294 RepID=A0AA96V9L2_9EURY|nr:B12-binding domain-containing protein [Methanimicrococcus sp. Es2]WNY29114.1 Methionine synthase [Methanimicrococcus sp. Es2]